MDFYKRFLLLFCLLFSLTLFSGFTITSQAAVIGFGVQKYRISPNSISANDTFDTLSQNQILNVLNDDGFPQNFVVYLSDISNIPSIEFFCQGQKVDISGYINSFDLIYISSRSSEKIALPIIGIKLEEGKNYEFRASGLNVSFTCKSSEKTVDIDKLNETISRANYIIDNFNGLIYEETLLEELKSALRKVNALILNNQLTADESDLYMKNIDDLINQLEQTKKIDCTLLQNDLFLGFSMSRSGYLESNPEFLQYGKLQLFLITTEKLSESNNDYISIKNQTTNTSMKITIKYKNSSCVYNSRLKYDMWYTPIESEFPSGNSFCLGIKKGLTFNNGQTAVLISSSKSNYSLIRNSDSSQNPGNTTKAKIEEEQNKTLTDISFSTYADVTEFLAAYDDFIKLSPDQNEYSLILTVCESLLKKNNGILSAQTMPQEDIDLIVKKIYQSIAQIGTAAELTQEAEDEAENADEDSELNFEFKYSEGTNPKVGDNSNIPADILLIISAIAILILLPFQLSKSKSSYRP